MYRELVKLSKMNLEDRKDEEKREIEEYDVEMSKPPEKRTFADKYLPTFNASYMPGLKESRPPVVDTEDEKKSYTRVSRMLLIYVIITQALVCFLIKILFYSKVVDYPGQSKTQS